MRIPELLIGHPGPGINEGDCEFTTEAVQIILHESPDFGRITFSECRAFRHEKQPRIQCLCAAQGQQVMQRLRTHPIEAEVLEIGSVFGKGQGC